MTRKAKQSDAQEGARPTYSWGWGVRLSGPAAWVGPTGETDSEFWWARRATAERLAMRYGALGRGVEIVHASRSSACTSPALDPWDEGFDPKRHTAECGKSLAFEVVENHTAIREALRAQKKHARELAQAARADKAARQMELRGRKARGAYDRPGAEGDAKALLVLYRAQGVARTARQLAAVDHLKRSLAGAREELFSGEELNHQWIEDQLCLAARDALRSDPKLADAILRETGKHKSGTCSDARATRERIGHERIANQRALRAAATARGITKSKNANAKRRADAAHRKGVRALPSVQ